MKDLPLSPVWPFWPIGKSITYVESMRTWGSNPPPATNLFNHLQSIAGIWEQTEEQVWEQILRKILRKLFARPQPPPRALVLQEHECRGWRSSTSTLMLL